MLTPREIVFRLKGGGDFTPLGGVETLEVVVPAPPVGVVVVVFGDASGENTAPSAYSDRLMP